MKINKKIILSVIIFLFIIAIIVIYFKMINKKEENSKNEEQVLSKNLMTIDELKGDTGLTGDAGIYEVQEEYDGKQILTIKASIKYKVAFAGMIKNSKPTMEELDTILNENSPKENGIWIEKDSRDKFLKIFNNNKTNSKYTIDDNGYLKIHEKNTQNDIDKKIEKVINGNKLYIFDISSVCYIVDDVSGEILDYNYEKMDKYQTYEYFDDNDKMIVFITQNSTKQLTTNEIFESIVELF